MRILAVVQCLTTLECWSKLLSKQVQNFHVWKTIKIKRNLVFLYKICRYELDNGQIFSEAGALKDDGVTQYVKGSYSFQGDDGETYWVNYTADEEGFHPVVG